jgi:hypothetical protein
MSRAYKNLAVHHDTGEFFSCDPLFLDPLFDWQLHLFWKLHNAVLKIVFNTPAHYAFSTL